MNRTYLLKLLSLLLAFGMVAAACGDSGDALDDVVDDATDAATDAADDAMEDDDGEAMEDDDEAMEEEGGEAAALADVCPSPLVVQTDWFPESEHGALYNLIGDDYTVDSDNKVVRGTMVTSGNVATDIEFEVRSGGPAIGFAPTASHLYTDDSIHLAYQNTEAQVLSHGDVPTLTVLAPLEINPQIVMWDPETYPEVEGIADLGEAGVTVNVFGGGVWSEVFVADGVLSADQVDPSYDGSPARFISDEGATAQQGFASAEPFKYEFEFEDWGKPVKFQTLHDAGFEAYAGTIAIRVDDKADLDACLKLVVPAMQQSQVDFINDPARANGIIIDAVETFADFWVYSQDVADYSVATQLELGLVGNGPDGTLGNIDLDRVQGVIDAMSGAGMDIADVTPEDFVTNEYIDMSIGL